MPAHRPSNLRTPAVAAAAAKQLSAEAVAAAADQETWQQSRALLEQRLGLSAEESDLILADAFGWGSQSYWRQQKVQEPPSREQVQQVRAWDTPWGSGLMSGDARRCFGEWAGLYRRWTFSPPPIVLVQDVALATWPMLQISQVTAQVPQHMLSALPALASFVQVLDFLAELGVAEADLSKLVKSFPQVSSQLGGLVLVWSQPSTHSYIHGSIKPSLHPACATFPHPSLMAPISRPCIHAAGAGL